MKPVYARREFLKKAGQSPFYDPHLQRMWVFVSVIALLIIKRGVYDKVHGGRVLDHGRVNVGSF